MKRFMTLIVVLVCAWALSSPAQTSSGATGTQKKPATAGAKSKKKMPGKKTPAQAGQSLIPVEQLQIYVDGFHNYKGEDDKGANEQTQMRVTHYCQGLPSGLIQCVIFDGNTKDSHLIGLEHIISDEAYQKLSDEEKAYWHPHDGEVDSGMLDLPGMDPAQKEKLKQAIRSTHGKTWHVWQSHNDEIPLGEPKLMWAVPPDKANDKTKDAMKKREQDPTFGPAMH